MNPTVPCACCHHDAATATRSILGVSVAVCADCAQCDPHLPHKMRGERRIALGECASWFYGYLLAGGRSTLVVPGTPAYHSTLPTCG